MRPRFFAFDSVQRPFAADDVDDGPFGGPIGLCHRIVSRHSLVVRTRTLRPKIGQGGPSGGERQAARKRYEVRSAWRHSSSNSALNADGNRARDAPGPRRRSARFEVSGCSAVGALAFEGLRQFQQALSGALIKTVIGANELKCFLVGQHIA